MEHRLPTAATRGPGDWRHWPKEAAPPDAAPLFTDDYDYDFGPVPEGEEEQDMVSEEQAAEAW